jgi:hypothetical protein
MEGKDVYILLAFALFRRRRPVLPHRRSPCRFTGDHLAHHVDDALPGLTPSTANFPTRNTCGLFLRVSEAKVYLIHQTAKEFLVKQESKTLCVDRNEWRKSFVLRHCDYMLAQLCVRYLSFTNFESSPFVDYVMSRYRQSQDQKLLDWLTSRYQFLEYCATQ